MSNSSNIDPDVVSDFGEEWAHFDQTGLSQTDKTAVFADYFAIFPWDDLPAGAVGADIGCGSGRWASMVASRVGLLHCIDPAIKALEVAERNLADRTNCRFHHASTDEIPLEDDSLDFAYSLGVLHHIPDTARAMRSCVAKLKTGAPFLVYLYYAFDNRPIWFVLLWRLSDLVRRVIARLPRGMARFASSMIAVVIYWPLARTAYIGGRLGLNVSNWPLSTYRNRGFYVMATDSLDRFGTKLEQRFTRRQIEAMMLDAGLIDISFLEREPLWTAVGKKA